MTSLLPHALTFTPEYRDYLWGGQRLRPGTLTAEAWVIYENDRIVSAPLAGKTLAQAAAEFGADLLGQPVIDRRGPRFPLLIKLLDCNQWLSLQVHPNDQQAREIQGPDQNGKTEAWHILEADPQAQLIAGLKHGTSAGEMAAAIRGGTILDLSQYETVQAGDTIFMRAGTIHALGPGLMVYEVQESSDLTYRVFDWNRPQTPNRVLHIDKSLAVADPTSTSHPQHLKPLLDGEVGTLVESEYFTLEILNARTKSLELDTRSRSFHALTVITGSAQFSSDNEQLHLNCFDSILIPASAGSYTLKPESGGCRILRAHL